MLPFRAEVDQGAMAMKGCSVFPKASTFMEPHNPGHSLGVGAYPTAEKPVGVLNTPPPADSAKMVCVMRMQAIKNKRKDKEKK